jgi:hypothetical protein
MNKQTTKKFNTMKTTYKISTLIASLFLMLAINLNASNFLPAFAEEAYIDDIPFDTELIFEKLTMPEFDFEEEAYINDIPAELYCTTPDCMYEKATSIVFETSEEGYIDDLPFNTEKIANEYQFDTALNMDFEMEAEKYIDDIPFSTALVSSNTENTKQEITIMSCK